MSKSEETRLLENAFNDPETLTKKLILAIALAPPKSRPRAAPRANDKRGRPTGPPRRK